MRINDGVYKLTVIDKKGNKQVIKFTIDSQAPLRIINPSEKYLKGVSKVIITNCPNSPTPWYVTNYFDPLSGLDWVKIDGTKISAKNISTIIGDGDMSKKSVITLCDKAGNIRVLNCFGETTYK